MFRTRIRTRFDAESIEWFLEVQAFSPSYEYWIVSFPIPPPVIELSILLSLPVCRRQRGKGVGSKIIQHGDKVWSSITQSILSGSMLILRLYVRSCSLFSMPWWSVPDQCFPERFSSVLWPLGLFIPWSMCTMSTKPSIIFALRMFQSQSVWPPTLFLPN